MINGFKILLNMLFEASEKNQLYEYDKFEVAESATDVVVAAAVLSVIVAALIALALYRKNILIISGIFLIFTGIQIYFGVFPPALLNVFLYAGFAAAVLYCSRALPAPALSFRYYMGGTIALAVLSGVIIFTWTEKNPSLYALSETIRDRFGEKVERPVNSAMRENNAPRQNQDQPDFMQKNPDDNRTDSGNTESVDLGVDYDYNTPVSQAGAAGPQTFTHILLIFFILVFGSLTVWIILRLRRESKRRKLFNSADCAEATNAMFKYLMDWLTAYGLIPQNDVYSKYANQITELSQKEYAGKYLGAVEIWQEAVYSEHKITEKHREAMRLFMHDTIKMVSKNTGILTKFRIRLGYFGGEN